MFFSAAKKRKMGATPKQPLRFEGYLSVQNDMSGTQLFVAFFEFFFDHSSISQAPRYFPQNRKRNGDESMFSK